MIPRTVIQTAESRSLPDEIVEARRAMIEGNPECRFLLFDAGDREDFILDAFGAGMLATYRSIDARSVAGVDRPIDRSTPATERRAPICSDTYTCIGTAASTSTSRVVSPGRYRT